MCRIELELIDMFSGRIKSHIRSERGFLYNSNTLTERFAPFQLATNCDSLWARAMTKAMDAGSLTEKFAGNDLRAKVATEAKELGQNATAMLGNSSDAVTKRHYERGTQKIEPLRKKY
jgi:hypothetical protein